MVRSLPQWLRGIAICCSLGMVECRREKSPSLTSKKPELGSMALVTGMSWKHVSYIQFFKNFNGSFVTVNIRRLRLPSFDYPITCINIIVWVFIERDMAGSAGPFEHILMVLKEVTKKEYLCIPFSFTHCSNAAELQSNVEITSSIGSLSCVSDERGSLDNRISTLWTNSRCFRAS